MSIFAKFLLIVFFYFSTLTMGCSSAKYAIYRNFHNGSGPIDDYAVVFTSANFRKGYVTKVYKINENFVHHHYYVLEPGSYTFNIRESKPDDHHTVVVVPMSGSSMIPVLTPNPGKYLGDTTTFQINLRAGHIYDLENESGTIRVNETSQNKIQEIGNPEFIKAFYFVKDNLAASAFKDGFGPYPIDKNSKP